MDGRICRIRTRAAGATLAMAALFAASMVSAPDAQAALLLESDMGAAGFSSDWASPTRIGSGIDRIEGAGAPGSYDNLLFADLPHGAQSLEIRFSAPAAINSSYAAGGTAFFDSQPFAHEAAGTYAGSFNLGAWNPEQSVMIELGGSFAGELYLALNFTHGAYIDYAILAPSNAATDPGHGPTPTPVPIPSSGLLLGALFGALALLVLPRRRRIA